MMRHEEWRMFGLGVAVVFAMCVAHMAPAEAQDDDAPPRVKVQGGPARKGRKTPAADVAYEASRRAYEALTLAERKAVQESLVWVAGYKGTLDGAFGKRTRDALIVFEKRDRNLNKDGIVDRGEFKLLVEAAKKAKTAVRFTMLADKASGLVIGLPLKLLTKRISVPGGSRFASADYAFVVETRGMAAPEGGLPALYEKLGADKDDRKVGYKTAKPDWFVVSGETGKAGDKHFYTRFDRRAGDEAGDLRGYTVLYDSNRADEFDRYAIAIANAAEAFPSDGAVAALDGTGGGEKPPPAVTIPPTITQTAPRTGFVATAVVFAPGKAVSVLPEACSAPSAGKRPLRVSRRDAATGVAVLEGVTGREIPPTAREPALAAGDSLVVVGFGDGGEGPILGVAAGEVTIRGASDGGRGEARIFAPLQADAAGSAVFDRAGVLRGIVGRSSAKPRLVAGIVPQASHPLLVGDAAAPLFAAAASATAPSGGGKRTAGEIAAAAKEALVAIECTR